MIYDGLTAFSTTQDLTVLTAGTLAPSTNVLDLSQAKDLGEADPLFIWGVMTTLPTSGTGGATLSASLQGSVDNATWVTIQTYGPTVLTALTGSDTFLFRSQIPIFGALYRYLRMGYTASAVLTAGQITSAMSINVPRVPYYPRNFVA